MSASGESFAEAVISEDDVVHPVDAAMIADDAAAAVEKSDVAAAAALDPEMPAADSALNETVVAELPLAGGEVAAAFSLQVVADVSSTPAAAAVAAVVVAV